jgi:cytochrome b6-f complex iron-sulfur subunit
MRAILSSRRGALLAALAPALLAAATAADVRLEPPARFEAGRVGDFARPGVYERHKAAHGVWVVRLPGGDLIALAASCPHEGCAPNWLALAGRFQCPCCGAAFDRGGVPVGLPAGRPLRRYRVSVRGGKVVIDKTAAPE